MEKATVLVTAMAFLGIFSIGLTAVLYQLVKQQGRLLLRLDQVERQLGIDPFQSIDRESIRLQARTSSGLPVGTLLPDFELPDLDGRPVSWKDFRGRKVLLVSWSARCGYCDRIAPDLISLEPGLARAGVSLLLLSAGTAEAERAAAEEHGLKSPILLQKSGTSIEAFHDRGTPVAYLIDEDGRIAHRLAIGSDQVLDLAREAAPKAALKRLPLSESRIERNGLKPGTPAPVFTLPSLDGGMISLDQYRGRKVLLVFSDPHCGPCEQLTPSLIQLHEKHRDNGLAVVVIGRGDPAENRRKAEEHRLEFPVAVQRKWEISRQYGIFATPAGFLIDENGMITDGVARGIEEILALVARKSDFWKGVRDERAS
ncbi:MAG TPA: redoxin domain-containing protein [Thermoanaerobaculia bacterium]|jgi:peroxiredoxin